MSKRTRGSLLQGQNEANITPLADVTTTLIVVFLITMPALMWNGIQVNQAEAGSETAIVKPTELEDDTLLTVVIAPDGITLNGEPMDIAELESELTQRLQNRQDKTVVIVPDDAVLLGDVVAVLDAAKASGAENLAMLNQVGG